jgi:hypothetical protein
MLEKLDKSLDENNIWLHRYIPFSKFERSIKNNNFYLNFTRVELFDDVLEGWSYDSPELTKAWLQSLTFLKRGINDGGKFENIIGITNFLYDNVKKSNNHDFQTPNVKNEILNYLNLIKSNYCSCWFISDSPILEKRYMWNLYGKANRTDLAIMISVKLTDLNKDLESSKKKFICGKIEYDTLNEKNSLFKKDNSYSHENEFRIISEDFNQEYNSFKLNNSIKKIITFSQPPSSEDYEKIKKHLNMDIDEIKYSQLPLQWELKELRKLIT